MRIQARTTSATRCTGCDPKVTAPTIAPCRGHLRRNAGGPTSARKIADYEARKYALILGPVIDAAKRYEAGEATGPNSTP